MPTSHNSISYDEPHVLARVVTNNPRTFASRGESRARSAPAANEVWGHYNNYRANGVAISATIHIALIALLVSGALFGEKIVQQVVPQRPTVTLIAPSPDSYIMPVAKKIVSGGGGGGDHDKLPAPKGRLPKVAPQQITPPAIVVHNEHPRLPVEPTVVAPQVHVAENHLPTLGVASAPVMPSAPPSNGTGSGGGIGSGSGGGVGVGRGPGVGPGSGGGIGGGVYKVGGGILAPQALATPDPQYTQEARDAKTQGTVILQLIVDQQGRPRDIRVVRGLGFGLDAKAIDAVNQWHFQPATKDGQPVSVQIRVEVGFHLY